MGTPLPIPRRLLWRRIWAWVLMALVLSWAALTVGAYSTGLHEADELMDGYLVSAAELLVRRPPDGAGANSPRAGPADRLPQATAYSPALHAIVWRDGVVVRDPMDVARRWPAGLGPGHHTLTLAGDSREWRSFVARFEGHGARYEAAVFVDRAHRRLLGREFAQHLVRPALVLLPLVALVLAFAIRRGLAPLEQLADQIAGLDIERGEPLPGQAPYRELAITAGAVNTLVGRLRAQVERERQFNADVAHELRTPLTTMVLQANALRQAVDDAQRTRAIDQIEAVALRSGRILGQLLELTRAQSLDRNRLESVDLVELARHLVAEHVPMAHERDQDLGLEAPEGPVLVTAHGPMLSLAVRNLIDNAVRHAPRGARIEVRIDAAPGQPVALGVADTGQGLAMPPAQGHGLGIGLRLVRRIADWNGIGFEQLPPFPPWTTRLVLRWPTPDSAGATAATDRVRDTGEPSRGQD